MNFLPGGAKYFDLPGLLALGAPGRVWVAGEGPELPKVIVTAYELAGAREQVVAAASGAGTMDAAVQWLLQGD